jgi:hypothetical protein
MCRSHVHGCFTGAATEAMRAAAGERRSETALMVRILTLGTEL